MSVLCASKEKRRHREGLISYSLLNYLRDGHSGSVHLFFQIISQKARGNGLKLNQGKFRFNIWKKKFTKRVNKHWNRLPLDVAESSSLEVFKRCIDVALKDTLSG